MDDLLDLRAIRGHEDVDLPVPPVPLTGVVDTELSSLW
jgi:hypothetical protein